VAVIGGAAAGFWAVGPACPSVRVRAAV